MTLYIIFWGTNWWKFYYQGEGDEEGCWLLHNAMRDALGTAYHPECFKDKEAQAKTEILDIQTKVYFIYYFFWGGGIKHSYFEIIQIHKLNVLKGD